MNIPVFFKAKEKVRVQVCQVFSVKYDPLKGCGDFALNP